MSDAIAGVLKIALGLVTNKLRTYSAEKLQDGGLTDQKFRGWIVRELDDIKFTLDALSRMHLSASISFFKQGVERLLMCFSESLDSGNESTKLSGELLKGQNSTGMKPSQQSVTVVDAVSLVNVIGKLKIESKGRFELAKGLFVKSGEEATLSFHNDALKTSERIDATEVRIASAILGNLDDPEVAVSDGLHFLTELHNMTAIKDIFTVHIKGGLKALFKKDSRAEIVETVTMINFMLADFISKFTKRRVGLFDWPMIECGDHVVHPIYYKQENVQKLKKMEIPLPWKITFPHESLSLRDDFAINSQGDIYSINTRGGIRKFDRATSEWKPFISPSVRGYFALAIDDKDMMYVVSSSGTLSVFNRDGNIVHQGHLEGLDGCFRRCELRMTVTKGKNIIIFSYDYCSYDETVTVYVCEPMNGKVVRRFPIRYDLQPGKSIFEELFPCDNSTDDEVIAARKTLCSIDLWVRFYVYTYTEEGEVKNTVKLYPSEHVIINDCITFDHVTNNYIVYFVSDLNTRVEYFSKTGERLNGFFVAAGEKECYHYGTHLISHRNGPMAVVDIRDGKVLFLRLPNI